MELAFPITVYWDLPPDLQPDDSLLKICDEIVECRPLMLQLYDPSLSLSAGVRSILERFDGKAVAISLTLSPASMLSLGDHPVNRLGVKEILLSVSSLESLGTISVQPDVGLSFSVAENNWSELPNVVEFCREHGLSRLVLPMQRIFAGETPFFLNASEQKVLEIALSNCRGIDGLRLTIHDPFLWRAFYPGVAFPQGGCQAANTMIAIAPDRSVYPCPTFPKLIGRLGAVALKDIISSPAKKEIRNSILRNPDACGQCPELSECRGGCRGRSYVAHGSFDDIDDACR